MDNDEYWEQMAFSSDSRDVDKALKFFMAEYFKGRQRPENKNEPKYKLVTANEIYHTEYPPVQWVVPDIIPEGLSKIDGGPKVGKSWLALHLGLAVSMGGSFMGHIRVEKKDVVYLALEDSKRRIHNRLHKIGIEPPENFFIMTPAEWHGTANDLKTMLGENKNIGLVMIDTLFMFHPIENANDYNSTYKPVSYLQRIATETETPIVLVHHTKKGKRDETGQGWADQGMGSQGINGGVDTILLLEKPDGKEEGTLRIKGRDVEDVCYRVKWDKTICGWEILEETAIVKEKPGAVNEVLEIIKKHPEGLTNKELTEITGKDKGNISKYTGILVEKNSIWSLGGKWCVKPELPEVENTDEPEEN